MDCSETELSSHFIYQVGMSFEASLYLAVADSERDMPGIEPGPLGWHTSALTTELKGVLVKINSRPLDFGISGYVPKHRLFFASDEAGTKVEKLIFGFGIYGRNILILKFGFISGFF